MTVFKAFYYTMEENRGSLSDLLHEIANKGILARNKEVGDKTVRLDKLEESKNGLILGDMLRISKKDLGFEADEEEVRPLKLRDGSGLEHFAGFCYDPTKHAFLYQETREVSLKVFSSYLREFDNKIAFATLPKLEKEGYMRFQDKQIRKLAVKLGTPQGSTREWDNIATTHPQMRLLKEAFNGLSIEVTISVGRKHKPSLSNVFGLLKSAQQASYESFEKLEVTLAKDDDGDDDENKVVNLLLDRL